MTSLNLLMAQWSNARSMPGCVLILCTRALAPPPASASTLGPFPLTRYTDSWPAARRLTSFNPRCFASVFLLLFSPCSTIAPLAACERGKNYQKI